jgi:hypothetical protein
VDFPYAADLLFLLPLFLTIGVPLIFLAAVATIVARFINAIGSKRPAARKGINDREE